MNDGLIDSKCRNHISRIVKVQNFVLKTSKSKLKVVKEQLLHKRSHSVLHEGTAQVSFRVNGLDKMQINIRYKHAPCTSNIHRAAARKTKLLFE